MSNTPVYYAEAKLIDEGTFAAANAPQAPLLNHSAEAIINEVATREFLASNSWPRGLQDTLLKALKQVPIRYFICDDSGSMNTSDGHRLMNNQMIPCSRWSELTTAMTFHAKLSHQANAKSVFRLLNGADEITIGGYVGSDSSSRDSLSSLGAIFENSPGGGTPLCHHIREVTKQIQTMAPQLRRAGQKAVLVIATDGESSDGDIAQAMRPLRDLPVWVVIRLCTDEEKIVDYWNNIDNELELDMDVLDDLTGEAGEVYAMNPWLTYAEPMHRLREFGVPVKEIDLLDEVALNRDQIRTFCSFLFGGRADDYPHPSINYRAFRDAVQQQAQVNGKVWNPMKRRQELWVNVNKLPGSGKCVVC